MTSSQLNMLYESSKIVGYKIQKHKYFVKRKKRFNKKPGKEEPDPILGRWVKNFVFFCFVFIFDLIPTSQKFWAKWSADSFMQNRFGKSNNCPQTLSLFGLLKLPIWHKIMNGNLFSKVKRALTEEFWMMLIFQRSPQLASCLTLIMGGRCYGQREDLDIFMISNKKTKNEFCLECKSANFIIVTM